VEIFGPTIQGEGVDQGVSAHFVRFGGCDFRCDWCDTPYAVIPKEVRENAESLSSGNIIDGLAAREKAPWVILTGGNPALLDLTELIDALHDEGYLVAVETQGTKWREWMWMLDRVCLSPKPPSSGQTYKPANALQKFFQAGLETRAHMDHPYDWLFIKIPIFDDGDLKFAVKIRKQLSDAPLFLSAGNDAGRTVGSPTRADGRDTNEVRLDLIRRYAWLAERMLETPELREDPNVIVQAQGHVLVWGNQKGK
jgi:7-carboxy-7-deazaguanine synthase